MNRLAGPVPFGERVRRGRQGFLNKSRRAQERALLSALGRIEGRGMEANAGAVYAEYLRTKIEDARPHLTERRIRSILATLAAEGYIVRRVVNRGRYGVTTIYHTPPNVASLPLTFQEGGRGLDSTVETAPTSAATDNHDPEANLAGA